MNGFQENHMQEYNQKKRHPQIRKSEEEKEKKASYAEKRVFAIFAAQRAAFFLMILGFLIFIFLWYIKNR